MINWERKVRAHDEVSQPPPVKTRSGSSNRGDNSLCRWNEDPIKDFYSRNQIQWGKCFSHRAKLTHAKFKCEKRNRVVSRISDDDKTGVCLMLRWHNEMMLIGRSTEAFLLHLQHHYSVSSRGRKLSTTPEVTLQQNRSTFPTDWLTDRGEIKQATL